MSKCPNCFTQLDKDGVCPACGYQSNYDNVMRMIEEGKFFEAKVSLEKILEKNENDGKACLLMTRVLTKNFKEKPEDIQQLREYAVKGLTYADEKDKRFIDYKLLCYFENLNLGGRGVSDVFEIKASIVSENHTLGENGNSHASVGGSVTPTAAVSSETKKARKPLSKKTRIIVAGCVAILVVGGTAGIIGSRISHNNSKKYNTETYIYLDKEGGSDGSDYVYGHYGQYLPSITVPQKYGYLFSGYYSEPNGYGYQYYDGSGSSINQWFITDASYTLYANWIANSWY